MSVRLGELLTKASLITQDQLKEALKVQKDTGGKLGETLIKLGFVSEEDITECLSQQFGVPSINLSHFEIDPSVIKRSEEHTSELQSRGHLVCRLLLEKKKLGQRLAAARMR